MKLVDTKDAVGTVLCHDITQIIKGVTKDARFRKAWSIAVFTPLNPVSIPLFTA